MQDAGGLIPAIVLAAGAGSRMGFNKLLVEVGGRPVLHHVIDALLDARMQDITVITGFQAEEIAYSSSKYQDRIKLLHNPQHNSGRSSSVKAGLALVGADAPGVLITPGDVPLISAELVQALLKGFNSTGLITFPFVNGRKGHPVVFPRSMFTELLGLTGEETLHDFMLANPDLTSPLEWADEGCTMDVDTPEELIRIRGRFSRRTAR